MSVGAQAGKLRLLNELRAAESELDGDSDREQQDAHHCSESTFDRHCGRLNGLNHGPRPLHRGSPAWSGPRRGRRLRPFSPLWSLGNGWLAGAGIRSGRSGRTAAQNFDAGFQRGAPVKPKPSVATEAAGFPEFFNDLGLR
jgi:hypothetical protein